MTYESQAMRTLACYAEAHERLQGAGTAFDRNRALVDLRESVSMASALHAGASEYAQTAWYRALGLLAGYEAALGQPGATEALPERSWPDRDTMTSRSAALYRSIR